MRRLFCVAAALLALMGPAHAGCRQALALGLDVSGSVDDREYALQLQGLARALTDPDVVTALLSTPETPVEIAVFEWSGPDYQRLLADWRAIDSRAALDDLANRLASVARRPAPPETAIGSAMLHGAALLDQRAHCWKRTLDLSGDCKNNSGPRPNDARDALVGVSPTVNGLVIGSDPRHAGDTREEALGELSAYFRAYVIRGDDAFVETALGFEDYEAAMVRKLKRELEVMAVSSLR